MGYGDHDDHVIWMNYVIPMASRIVMIYPWKIIPYHTNKGYWGRVSSIRHVNTLWCLSPESFLGFWGTWKIDSEVKLFVLPVSCRACFGMMIGVYGVDIRFTDGFLQQTWRLCYFSCEQTSFSKKIRLGFVFQSQFLDYQIIFSQGWTETAFFRVELHQGAAWEILWELGLSRGRACHEWGLSTKPCLITIEKYYNIYIYIDRYYKIACEEHAFMLFWHGHWMTMRSWMPLYFFQLQAVWKDWSQLW